MTRKATKQENADHERDLRKHEHVGYYSCTARRERIVQHMACWPCSNLHRVHRLWAQWDSRNGDLIDIRAVYRNGRTVPSVEYDDPAALALINDMQAEMHPEHAR